MGSRGRCRDGRRSGGLAWPIIALGRCRWPRVKLLLLPVVLQLAADGTGYHVDGRWPPGPAADHRAGRCCSGAANGRRPSCAGRVAGRVLWPVVAGRRNPRPFRWSMAAGFSAYGADDAAA